jgi:hypothetical protein
LILDKEGNPQYKPVLGTDLEEPDIRRIEVGLESVVSDDIPSEVVKDWLKEGWIHDDPTKEHVAHSSEPPRTLMPLVEVQKIEAAKTRTGSPVLGRTIPPRPIGKV